MEEQPVALAMMARSPYSWEINLRYGVSPQPAQAPENSNNGCKSCEFFTVFSLISPRSTSGSVRKYSQFTFSVLNNGATGSMFTALRPLCLSTTGQPSTHSAQPVQSSGEIGRGC